jgi:mercuric reductase
VEVDGKCLTGEKILIATGSRPIIPNIDGPADPQRPIEFWELPRSLIILGGGYVALELGQMFRRLGAEVTILERSAQLLSRGYEPGIEVPG